MGWGGGAKVETNEQLVGALKGRREIAKMALRQKAELVSARAGPAPEDMAIGARHEAAARSSTPAAEGASAAGVEARSVAASAGGGGGAGAGANGEAPLVKTEKEDA